MLAAILCCKTSIHIRTLGISFVPFLSCGGRTFSSNAFVFTAFFDVSLLVATSAIDHIFDLDGEATEEEGFDIVVGEEMFELEFFGDPKLSVAEEIALDGNLLASALEFKSEFTGSPCIAC